MEKEKNTDVSSRQMILSKLLNAPRELVWEAWVNPEHAKHWWGPDGFTNTIYEMNVKPGGVWRFMMHGPGGMDFPNKIVFREVRKPEFLSFTHGSDIEDDPAAFETVVTFEKQGNKTLLTMTAVFPTAEERDRVVKEFGAAEGGKQTLNRLENYLSNNMQNQ